jgi:hypothetical protein
MALPHEYDGEYCPMARSLEVIGERVPRRFYHADCGGRLDDSRLWDRCGQTPGPHDVETRKSRLTSRPQRDDRVSMLLSKSPRLLDTLPGVV